MTSYAEFNRCWPWLAGAMARTIATHDKDDLWKEIEAETVQLWYGAKSAMVTRVTEWPDCKLVCLWLAGGELEELLKMLPTVERWAKKEHCANITIVGRWGWKNVLAEHGYKMTAVMLVKEL